MRVPYRPRWPLLVALVVGVGAVIGLTYVRSEPVGEVLPAYSGRYVEGVAGSPSRVNPLFASSNPVDRDLVSLVFSGLVRLGSKGNVQPDLAVENPKVTPDGLTYIFQLRQDLLWHDGELLDADDVLFTVRAIQDAEFEGDRVLADLFRDVEVEASDQFTVIMTLPEPFAPFLSRAATVGILPEHLLGELDATGLFGSAFNQTPVGSGPFRLVDRSAAVAVLQSFESYHLGRPFLSRLELAFYRDDDALLTALLNEEVDGALFRPGLGRDDILLLDDESRWVRRALHSTTYSLIYLNPRVDAFEDVLVRRALQRGLDREALIETSLAGQAIALDSPIVRDLWAYVGSPETYSFDPTRAGLLLDVAGWVRDADGWAKEGVVLQFMLATSDDPVQLRLAEGIAQQWSALGIQVDVEISNASDFVDGVLLLREFDAALVSVDPGPDPDLYPFWHSTQALTDGRNLASFSDPVADRLLEDGRLATSATERAVEYEAFQEIFARELPAVLLHAPVYQYVARSDLKGLSPGLLLDLSARFQDVHLWFLETEIQAEADE